MGGVVIVRHKGNFNATKKFFSKARNSDVMHILQAYGEKGVQALANATPKDTGKTASSWSFSVERKGKTYSVSWTNSNTPRGISIALILQYGHGTGTGGYVQGRDYINPALQPIFDAMADEAFKEVAGT